MVTYAERAHVGEAEASAGSTIYEGDRLSTEAKGILRITTPNLTLQMNAQTTLTVRHPASSDDLVEAELAAGTIIFSVARTAKVQVISYDALIRPATSLSTIAQVRVVSRKDLRIFAQRGALEFSYHGERQVIAEGTTCRAILDPSEEEVVLASETEQGGKKAGSHHLTFLLVTIGIAAATAAIAIPLLTQNSESPYKPGP